MSSDNELERLLSGTPGPRVVAGAHRADLKARLLQSMRKERPVKRIWKPLLVACCVVALLAAGGWAANEVRQKFFVVEESHGEKETVVNPDGSVTVRSTSRVVVSGSNDPNFTEEDAHRNWAQVKQAIDEGNYTLAEVKETDVGLVYCYRIVLEDGSIHGYGTSEPLPEPDDE